MKPAARRIVRIALRVALGLAAAGGLAWLLRPEQVPVDTAAVARGPLETTLDAEGETRIQPRRVIAAPVAGRLLAVDLREGDAVAAGETVARLAVAPLDPRDRRQAEAAVASARAGREEALARVSEAKAALAQSRLTRERSERLAAAGTLAAEALDQARTAERTQAELLDAAKHRAEAAAGELAGARAALLDGGAPSSRGVVRLTAPVAGRVLRRFEESERVVAAGTPILEIGDPARLEAVVDVLSTDAVSLAPGAAIRLDVGGGKILPTRLRAVEPAGFTKISPLGVEEQRVRVIGDLLEPEPQVGDRFRVLAAIVLWRGEDVLQVPAGAVFRTGEAWSVFVVENGRARRREIHAGHRNPNSVEVLGGLQAGERVILYPSDRVSDGARVTAENER